MLNKNVLALLLAISSLLLLNEVSGSAVVHQVCLNSGSSTHTDQIQLLGVDTYTEKCSTIGSGSSYPYLEIPFRTSTDFIEVKFNMGTCAAGSTFMSVHTPGFNPSNLCDGTTDTGAAGRQTVFFSTWSTTSHKTVVRTGWNGGNKEGTVVIHGVDPTLLDCCIEVEIIDAQPAAEDVVVQNYCWTGNEETITGSRHVQRESYKRMYQCGVQDATGSRLFKRYPFKAPSQKADFGFGSNCYPTGTVSMSVHAPRFNNDSICDQELFFSTYSKPSSVYSGAAWVYESEVVMMQYLSNDAIVAEGFAPLHEQGCCFNVQAQDYETKQSFTQQIEDTFCFDGTQNTIQNQLFDFSGFRDQCIVDSSQTGNFPYFALPFSTPVNFAYDYSAGSCNPSDLQLVFMDNFDETQICNNLFFASPKVYQSTILSRRNAMPLNSYAVIVNKNPSSTCCFNLNLKTYFPLTVEKNDYCFTPEAVTNMTAKFFASSNADTDKTECRAVTPANPGIFPALTFPLRSLDPIYFTYNSGTCGPILTQSFINELVPTDICGSHVTYYYTTNFYTNRLNFGPIDVPVDEDFVMVLGSRINVRGTVAFPWGCCINLEVAGTTSAPTISSITDAPTPYNEINIDGDFCFSADSERSNGFYTMRSLGSLGTCGVTKGGTSNKYQFERISMRSVNPITVDIKFGVQGTTCTVPMHTVVTSAPMNKEDICQLDFFYSPYQANDVRFGPISTDLAGAALPPNVEIIVSAMGAVTQTCCFNLKAYGTTQTPSLSPSEAALPSAQPTYSPLPLGEIPQYMLFLDPCTCSA